MDTAADILNSNLSRQISGLTISDTLHLFTELFPGQVSFSTSFSLEDQVILHHIAVENLPITVFTLDTGRLFPETYSVWTASREKYGIPIRAFIPDETRLENYVNLKGPNAFYESVENRKECCYIRKVEPLETGTCRTERSGLRVSAPNIPETEASCIYSNGMKAISLINTTPCCIGRRKKCDSIFLKTKCPIIFYMTGDL